MTISRISGWAAALLGALLLWFQGSGMATYMARGAALSDALTVESALIIGSALLVLIAGFLYATGRGFALWVAMLALALNGVVLFVTMMLGTDRPAWIVGAIAELDLITAIIGGFIERRNTAAPH